MRRTGIDNQIGIVAVLLLLVDILTHNDSHLLATQSNVLHTATTVHIGTVVANTDKLFGYISFDFAILDKGHSTYCRTVLTLDGQTHQSRDTIAEGCNLHQSLLAVLKEGYLFEQTVCGSSADRQFGKDHQVSLFAFCAIDCLDDFGSISVEITDGIIQLSESNFHLQKTVS